MVMPFFLRAPGILLVHTLSAYEFMLLLRAAGLLLYTESHDTRAPRQSSREIQSLSCESYVLNPV